MQILVVDDDNEIIDMLARGLRFEGYDVRTALDGDTALTIFRESAPDLVLLDVMMPGKNGLEVCREMRKIRDTPVVMLTAKDAVTDRVAGLDSGADDYIVKPFAFDELLARVRAHLRRTAPGDSQQVIQFSDLILNTVTHEVHRSGQLIELTSKEFELLQLFMLNPRKVLSREVIYDKVWGYDFGGESNIIEVYIRYLRSKLDTGNSPKLIRTVRGVGYVMKESDNSHEE
ncbi:MAG: response regulator transcription factor [Chloroflexi bacterium]|uniref:Response regulator transcription factor n=1 Tax=Candidatus Chlorohelix allophototropha TaxID=3003348 RepID=A0A8T7LTM3_9CHLR|nr:response regulator transcription factor [Chloroflexota bacterium]WJW67246.1 response regulator transcription factor [Chloroflexota bacterium L227-S17]